MCTPDAGPCHRSRVAEGVWHRHRKAPPWWQPSRSPANYSRIRWSGWLLGECPGRCSALVHARSCSPPATARVLAGMVAIAGVGNGCRLAVLGLRPPRALRLLGSRCLLLITPPSRSTRSQESPSASPLRRPRCSRSVQAPGSSGSHRLPSGVATLRRRSNASPPCARFPDASPSGSRIRASKPSRTAPSRPDRRMV